MIALSHIGYNEVGDWSDITDIIENTDGFDVAKDAYLKLFTYVDALTEEKPNMTMEETLQYAGLLSFMDEELYINLNEYFLKK